MPLALGGGHANQHEGINNKWSNAQDVSQERSKGQQSISPETEALTTNEKHKFTQVGGVIFYLSHW